MQALTQPRTQNPEPKHVVIDAGDLLHVRTTSTKFKFKP